MPSNRRDFVIVALFHVCIVKQMGPLSIRSFAVQMIRSCVLRGCTLSREYSQWACPRVSGEGCSDHRTASRNKNNQQHWLVLFFAQLLPQCMLFVSRGDCKVRCVGFVTNDIWLTRTACTPHLRYHVFVLFTCDPGACSRGQAVPGHYTASAHFFCFDLLACLMSGMQVALWAFVQTSTWCIASAMGVFTC